MPTARLLMLSLLGLAALMETGCGLVPRRILRQSQLQSMRLHQQRQLTAMERDQANQMAQQMAQRTAELEANLQTANSRLNNLQAERSQLQQRYVSLLDQAKNQPSPLSSETTRRFEELARKYPQFEFDPVTGVSKFHSDILFTSGSADIKQEASPVLQEFASILNEGDAQRLNILVVGHTDDRPISKQKTAQQHPTNWHLSTNRAGNVVLSLAKAGITENRMGVAGYSMYQPVVENTNEQNRQQNRRVEIYVLAPDAQVAGWENSGTAIK